MSNETCKEVTPKKGTAYNVSIHDIPEMIDFLKEAQVMMGIGVVLAQKELKRGNTKKAEEILEQLGRAFYYSIKKAIGMIVADTYEVEVGTDGKVRNTTTGEEVKQGERVQMDSTTTDVPPAKFTAPGVGSC